ncbi:MAG: hypothetical protein IT260_21055 [Saprospiraceae bacterium]|nr:hypothetical protein [Saprospiraceae bacterium]
MNCTSTFLHCPLFSFKSIGAALLLCLLAGPVTGQLLFDSFADGNFTASPVWGGNTSDWQITANSDVAAGATGSNTLRLSVASGSGTKYLSSQIGVWGTSQEWGFWVGRRAQAFTGANQMYIWLYANEANLSSATVDGYRLAIGDNDAGGDVIRLEYIVNGALSATVFSSSGSISNGTTDMGFLVRVTRSATGNWVLFTSTLPTTNGSGAVATAVPNSTNATVNQGNAIHNTLVPAASGYLGVAALHSTGADARATVEFDQAYFTTQVDYTISTASNAITLTDASGNAETLTVSENTPNIRFDVPSRTYSLNGGIATSFPADVPLSGVTSITINTATGNDVINVEAFTASLPSLTINGGTGDDVVNFNGDISFAADANLDLDLQNDNVAPGVDAVTFATNANVLLSSMGTATVKVSKNVTINQGAGLETVNGNLVVEANQQTSATAGIFYGILLSNAGSQLKCTGTGSLTVKGRGGNDNAGIGVYLNHGGAIQGGSGEVTVEGTGGAATAGSLSIGVVIDDLSLISSTGGNVSVTGGSNAGATTSLSYGILIDRGSQITAGGTGTVTVVGQGGSGSGGMNYGIYITGSGTPSQVTSSSGAVSVTGTGGAGASGYGVYILNNGKITAGGTGTVTVTGQGGTGVSGSNYGVFVTNTDATITSGGGSVTITGKEGAGPNSLGLVTATSNASITTATNGGNITLIANSMDIGAGTSVSANGSSSITLRPFTSSVQTDLGSATNTVGGPLGLSDTELDLVTAGSIIVGSATSGDITVSADITRSAATDMSLVCNGDVLISGGQINTGGGTLLLDPGASPKAVKPTQASTDVTASTLSFGSDLAIVINGTNVDAQYTQLYVAGDVDLSGVDLVLSGTHLPAAYQTFTIVNNTGANLITGTFTGLIEGATISNFLGSALDASITYIGGDGNDVVLTVLDPCSTITFTATPSNTGSCNNSGQIVVSGVSGGTAPYEYSNDNGGNYQPGATFTGLAANTYQVVVKDANGCTSAATPVLVGTNPAPACSVSGADNVCSNSTGNIYTAPGGMSAYAWSISGAGVIVGSTTGASVTVTAGNYLLTYTVSVTVTDANGCMSSCDKISDIFLFSPSATITPSANPACFGVSINLSTPAASSSTLSWSGSGVVSPNGNPSTMALPAATGPQTYTVTVLTDYGCSNTGTVTITVNPLPTATCPSYPPVCINAPAFALAGGSPAGGSYSGPGVSSGMFDASAAGPGMHSITYTYLDGNGCVGTCTFTITVLSNCNLSFSGQILFSNNNSLGVKDANVVLAGSASGSDLSDVGGNFEISTLVTNGNFTLTPSKTVNKLNGVTAVDVTAIQQHVANSVPITDLYKLVAADVNKSNSINTLDASVVQQSLLGNPAALAQFKTSWRFVPTSHTMINPPWGFPEQRSYTGISINQSNQNFYGIKTGDVVTSFANPANFGPAGGLEFRVADQVLQAGSELVLEFRASQLDDLAAFQLALQADPAQLHLLAIEPLTALPLSLDHFGLYNIANGELRLVWAQATGAALPEAAPVFRLRFAALQSGAKLSEVLRLDETPLPALNYTSALAESAVGLVFTEATGTGTPTVGTGLRLFQNQPNPFRGATRIGFVLPQAGAAQLRIFDAAGRLLAERQGQYAAGQHEERFENLDAGAGVGYYELVTPFGVLTRKMVVLGE